MYKIELRDGQRLVKKAFYKSCGTFLRWYITYTSNYIKFYKINAFILRQGQWVELTSLSIK